MTVYIDAYIKPDCNLRFLFIPMGFAHCDHRFLLIPAGIPHTSVQVHIPNNSLQVRTGNSAPSVIT